MMMMGMWFTVGFASTAAVMGNSSTKISCTIVTLSFQLKNQFDSLKSCLDSASPKGHGCFRRWNANGGLWWF
ncbi:hypothetical protein HanIR_Chr07g0304091 [Helianthus annuus]|nr:hypothetical protein HanIR_Chr07g0304091 [Helianthus annuus]